MTDNTTTKSRILVLGPDVHSKGGMATVIQNCIQSDKLNAEYDIVNYPTYRGGNALSRGVFSLSQYLKFSGELLQYDIYHIHLCSGTSTWRKLGYLHKIKDKQRVILHVHGARYHLFYDKCSARKQQKIREAFQSVGQVVVLSEEWRKWFVDRQICPENNLTVLHNAVPVPKNIERNYQGGNVLFMGRMGERKSPDTLLKAAKIVLSQHPDARFVFGGDGEVEIYKQMAQQMGIENSCQFLGWVSGTAQEEAYRNAEFFCLPSKNEGMPMSVLEAMSFGAIPLATPVGGVPQVIDDGKNGFVFEIGDFERVAEILNNLMDDSTQAKNIGIKARQTICNRFSIDVFSEKLIELYKHLLEL